MEKNPRNILARHAHKMLKTNCGKCANNISEKIVSGKSSCNFQKIKNYWLVAENELWEDCRNNEDKCRSIMKKWKYAMVTFTLVIIDQKSIIYLTQFETTRQITTYIDNKTKSWTLEFWFKGGK